MKKNIKLKNSLLVRIILGTVLVLYCALFFVLIYWALVTAVKTDDDLLLRQNYFGLPKDFFTGQTLMPWQWAWSNFLEATTFFEVSGLVRNGREISVPFITQVLYTLEYSIGCAFLNTLSPCLVAYVTSKFKYKFNIVIESIVIISMILPIVGSSMSMISMLNNLRIYDTFFGIFCQKFGFGGMYFLVLSGVFKGVSKEYYEAAHIDGASELNVMLRIAFPLVFNTFMLIFLLHFIGFWNDYNTPLLYAPSHPTMSYGLFRMMTDSTGNSRRGSTPVQMAGCVLIVVPVVIIFIIFRNKLMGNLTIGGVKE